MNIKSSLTTPDTTSSDSAISSPCHGSIARLQGFPQIKVPSTGAQRSALALLIGMAWAAPALAQLSDTISPFLASTINYDDNLTRVDKSQPQAAGVSESDTYKTQAGGITLDRPIGRQRLTGVFTLSRVTFDRNTQYDYNGKNGKTDLAWQIGNYWQGNIGVTYDQSLASFADYHSTERSLRTYKREYVTGAWRFHPSWDVRANASQDKFSYTGSSQSYSNNTTNTGDVGADYLAPSGSKVGFLFRRVEATYPNQVQVGSAVFRNDYDQNEAKININWIVSGITNITFLGGWVKRKHPFSNVRDDSGTNGRLVATWAPWGKTQIYAQVYREFASAESTLVNSALQKGVQINGTWKATSKITAIATVREERRDFQPLVGVDVVGSLNDKSHYQSVGLTYAPLPNISLKLTAFHDARTGAAAAGTTTYNANGASFSGSVQF